MKDKQLDMFPLLSENVESAHHADISEQIIHHLAQLSQKFDYYFPEDPRPGNLWILNPFAVDSAASDVALPVELENELVELSEDRALKLKYQEVDLTLFWIHSSKEYPLLSEHATKFLLPFTTTYLCESSLFTVTVTKSKAQNSLKMDTLNTTLHVSLSPIQPLT